MMLKRTAVLFACLVGCAPLARLRSDPPTYFPMDAGRTWEYRLTDFGQNRVWPVGVRSRGPQFVPELGRVAAIFDEQYPDDTVPVAFFLSQGFLQGEIGLGYGATGDEGRAMRVLPVGTQPLRLMPVPPRVGMRWRYSEDVFGGFDDRGSALVIQWSGGVTDEEAIEVPAGRFERCLRVESAAIHRTPAGNGPGGYRYRDWYAPEVGLVKSEYSLENGSVLTRLELVVHGSGGEPGLPPTSDMLFVRWLSGSSSTVR